ncbi:MAG TPA: 3-deoxy-7-phosphoheptulonate synthase [Candidatus Acidoferrum sp.]|jgi:3-deoxy-7-phosphoheptulonate synthase|nr:3-deoxy-7-phosphoheptulonate synthase [Candidatus Acidoferrum sp.]
MVIVMQEGASDAQIQNVIDKLIAHGFDVHRSTGASHTVLGAVGVHRDFDHRDFELLEGVREVMRITQPFKLASRQFKPEGTVIDLGRGVKIGGPDVVVAAGPCSVESREQMFAISEAVSKAGAKILRAGAFKPRTSPYAFQGMGEPGLKIMREAAEKFGLFTVSEVMDPSQVDMMGQYVDIYQVGARNMQNYHLLRALGEVRKPVLLKRGMSATMEELLLSAEYILAGGNYNVILCERGIRTFETYTRNTFDLAAIPVIQKLSHLPMWADPSHGTGRRDKVPPMARAAVAAGADGLLIEVHNDPEHALSDGAQSLEPANFTQLMAELRIIAPAIGRRMA